MIFAYFLTIYSKIYEQCELPEYEGYILTKFYKPKCPYSIKVKGIVDEIDAKLEHSNSGFILRYVDCKKCDCDKDDIITVPTLAIHKNHTEVARHRGSGTLDEYVDFLVKNTGIDKSIFSKNYKYKSGEVMLLRETDFEGGLEGPWIVLFYETKNKALMELMNSIAKNYDKKVNVGAIDAKHISRLEKRYNIQSYPLILGVYNGVVMPYMKKPEIGLLSAFVDELIEPAFQPMTVSRFNAIKDNLSAGEPIFVVFYSDLSLANSYFRRMAHEYRFKTRIYRSNDKELFEKASAWPKFNSENVKENISDEEKVILTVYKQGIFHRCPHKLSEMKEISEWIFFSHFPHVTRIANENFYSVFHGFKPAVLLVTRSEEYVKDLEKVSTSYHLGLPFTSFVFSTIDTDIFPLFLPSLLPNLRQPAIVIFNPLRQLFYHKKFKMDGKTFSKNVTALIKDYERGAVDLYPPKKNTVMKCIFICVGIIGIAAGIISFVRIKKRY